jgi:hypothetical protein
MFVPVVWDRYHVTVDALVTEVALPTRPCRGRPAAIGAPLWRARVAFEVTIGALHPSQHAEAVVDVIERQEKRWQPVP